MTRAPMTPRLRERTERLQVIVPHEQLAAINDFRFRAMLRELLRRGLSEQKKERG
jgi:hypothetical protein